MNILAIIPARSGSKSIHKKNILMLGGKPMMAYSIESALQSKEINKVIVSTDCNEIAEIARTNGAEVPFLRDPQISGDLSSDYDYLKHALDHFSKEKDNYYPDLIAVLRPTHPIRQTSTIDKAINIYKKNLQYDSLRSIRVAKQSPFKMWYLEEENNYLRPIIDKLENISTVELFNSPRQILPKIYWQDGYIDVVKPQTILEKKSSTGNYIYPFIIDEDTIDVDYMDEFEQLEKIIMAGKKTASTYSSDRVPS